jgi:SAM-dependent methyltransferase
VELPVRWFEALERRHLAELTFSETARALRALSSCYVERRSRLSAGGALESRGKRAAFALFYGPLHFILTTEIIRALDVPRGLDEVVDLGCGTGAAGAAFAIDAAAGRVTGIDRNPWAVAEANWTYRELQLKGRAVQGDVGRYRLRAANGSAIVAAYTVNEVSHGRTPLRDELLRASSRGAKILIIEPIARGIAPWWDDWRSAFERAGGRADEWRFPSTLPPRQRELARAAGLDPRELTARSLWL